MKSDVDLGLRSPASEDPRDHYPGGGQAWDAWAIRHQENTRQEVIIVDIPRTLALIGRASWWIIPLTVLAMLGTGFYVERLPKVYVATVRILAPQPRQDPGGRVDGLLGLAAAAVSAQPSGVPAQYLAYLESQAMADAVVESMRRRPESVTPREMVQEAIARREVMFNPRSAAVIEVRVRAADPGIAALIANLYPVHLDRMLRASLTEEARQQRRFLEARLAQAREALPRYRDDPAPTLALIQALTIQIAQARIAEARDVPVVQVLDPATPPAGPIGPKVRQTVQFAGALTFIAACLVAIGRDAARRRKSCLDSYQQQGIGA